MSDLSTVAMAAGVAHGAATVHLPQIRYLAILPEIVMLGGAVLLLAGGSLVRRPLRPAVSTAATVAISGTALGLSLWQWADVAGHGAYTAIDKAVVVDGFSVLVSITVSVAMLLTALVSDGYLRREGISGLEFNVLAMVSASGAMLMGEANDLVIVFLGLEILSIALYVLAAFNPTRAASGEGALKYFILGGFSSAIFVYGIALVYGATGSTNLLQIADFLSENVVVSDGILLGGLSLLLVGFAFKIAAVPFHMWSPDVYQGSPSPAVGFMAAIAKVGAFAALLRIFISTFGVLGDDWRPVVYLLAALTLVVGAVLALVQRDIKRMLAYSSINHAGFVLLGLQAGSAAGVSSALYYLFAYTVMVIGTFAVVSVLGRQGDRAHDIAGYRHLARRQPVLALCLAVLLLAQAGAPFTTGFLAKLQVVAASIDASSLPLAAIAMGTAAIAAFFYLRVVLLMYTPVSTLTGAMDVASAADGAGTDDDDGAADGQLEAGEASEGHAVVTSAQRSDPTGRDAVREPWAPAVPPGYDPVLGAGGASEAVHPRAPVWAGTEEARVASSRIDAVLLLEAPTGGEVYRDVDDVERTPGGSAGDDDREPSGSDARPLLEDGSEEGPAVEPVPVLTAVAIGICVATTVVLGVIPAPLIDFAHQAKLLFGA